MKRRLEHVALIALALVGAVALSGCDPIGLDSDRAPQESTPSASATIPAKTPRQAAYEQAVQDWAFPLPEGYAWPESVPRDFPAGGSAMTGEQVVRRAWGCAVIDSAWELQSTDPEQAAAQLDLLQQDSKPWDLPYYSDGWTNNARTAGDSGLCLQWIDGGYVEYP